ncbi:hypothetical protein TGAM01_v210610 [Trichoderma gamsii]|uniref:Hydrophobin n=1 Tax=Trichoderma gamsii TaxID=398673 RepID=A0A2P4Z886_9HYPO|nr:hypothetical protein TGAM01_v210610 [Trichoderma gamsii]PON20508.1 hypothetical protein TGAM01_v210610 [Trichoderma gamsii]
MLPPPAGSPSAIVLLALASSVPVPSASPSRCVVRLDCDSADSALSALPGDGAAICTHHIHSSSGFLTALVL